MSHLHKITVDSLLAFPENSLKQFSGAEKEQNSRLDRNKIFWRQHVLFQWKRLHFA